MASVLLNEEYQSAISLSKKFSCEITKSERSENDRLDSPESLKSFSEEPEANHSEWMETMRKSTWALQRWQKQTTIDFQNLRGKAFIQCALPHPHEDLPSAKQDKNGESRQESFLALETTLNRIAKARRGRQGFQSDAERDYTSGRVAHLEALENYCQQHAYSKARLVRTDRRALANELLEKLSIDVDEEGMLLPQPKSPNSDPALLDTSRVSLQRVRANVVDANISYKSCNENLDFKSHRVSSRTKDNKNTGYEQRKESRANDTHTTPGKNSATDAMHESFMVTPCVLFPSEAFCESRNRLVRRHQSVQRCVPRSIYDGDKIK